LFPKGYSMSSVSKTKPPGTKAEPLERDMVKDWARKHQVEFPTAENVLWLTSILRAITTSGLGEDFALIGGSAIVFLYRDMYRFSTDLDLDFVGHPNLGYKGIRELEERKEKDLAMFEEIARQLGLKFKPLPKPQPRFAQYEMIYPSAYTRTGKVELDVSYRYCHSVLGTVPRPWPITDDSFLPAFSVNTLKEEEIYASKAIAMVDVKERLDFPNEIGLFTKRKIRHLFDVYLLASEALHGKSKIDLKRFRDLFVLFGMTRIKNFEYFRGNAIGSYTDADIKSELLSVVPQGFPVPTVDEMKWTVRKFLDLHVFNYREREYRFMEDFRSGHFRPEDLFGAGDIASMLSNTQYYKEILGKVAPLQKHRDSRGKRAIKKAMP